MNKVVADRYGQCVICHTNMMYEQVIDGKVRVRFDSSYSETSYLLDDGSTMRVAICKKCKPKLEDREEEKKYVMDCVKEGWKVETAKLVNDGKKMDWTQEKRSKYMDKYNKLSIVMRADGIERDVLNKRLKEHRSK